jgi:tetratricopeptide (TPR) repeat protein
MKNHILKSIFSLMLVAATGLFVGCGTPREQSEKKMEKAAIAFKEASDLASQGKDAESDDKVVKALDLCEDAIAKDPTNVDAYVNYAYMLQAKKLFTKSLEVMDKAKPLAKENLSKGLQDKSIPDSTLRDLKNQFNTLYIQSYDAYTKLGKRKEALESLQQAYKPRELFPKKLAEAELNYGYFLQGNKQLDSAIVHFQKAIEINPEKTEKYNPYYYLATAYEVNKNTDGAIGAYKQAVDQDSTDTDSFIRLAALYDKTGKPDEANKYYAIASAKNPKNSEVLNNWAANLLAKGKTAEALPKFEKAVEISPKNASLYINLGNAYEKSGNKAKAITAFDKFVDLAKNDPNQSGNVTKIKQHIKDLGGK